jgi:hypothetical protein
VNDPETIDWPIDGTLDLHLFRPGEIKELVPDYLSECRVRVVPFGTKPDLRLGGSQPDKVTK